MKKNIALLLLPAILFITCSKKSKDNSPIYPVDCATQLAGAYVGNDYCTSSGQSAYPCTIVANTSTNITISNLSGVTVTAVLDCNKNTVTIPTQTFTGNFSLSGSGTYTANRIIITWSGIYFGTPINCSTTYLR